MAGAWKRGSRWYICYRDEGGRELQRVTRAKTKSEARELAEDLERRSERIRLGLEAAPTVLTFSELATQYLATVTGRRSYTTIEGRFRLHLIPTLGPRPIAQVLPAELDQLLAAKKREGLSDQTLRHLLNHVSAAYRFAIEKLRAATENPAKLADRPVVAPVPPRFLEVFAVERVLANVAPHWRCYFAFACLGGFRRGELNGMRTTDVDVGRRVILVQRSNDSDTTKTSRLRYVPINDELLVYARLAVNYAGNRLNLFGRRNGAALTKDFKATEILRRALVKSGLDPKYSFKDLRSTFATHLTEATGDLRAAQLMLGHGDERTTGRHYSAGRAGHLLQQANRLRFTPVAAVSPLQVKIGEERPTVLVDDQMCLPGMVEKAKEDQG